MGIRFRCPNGHVLKAGDDKSGLRMRCPACREVVLVPSPQAASPSEAKVGSPDPRQPAVVTKSAPQKPSSAKPDGPAAAQAQAKPKAHARKPTGAKAESPPPERVSSEESKPALPAKPPPLPKPATAKKPHGPAAAPPPLKASKLSRPASTEVSNTTPGTPRKVPPKPPSTSRPVTTQPAGKQALPAARPSPSPQADKTHERASAKPGPVGESPKRAPQAVPGDGAPAPSEAKKPAAKTPSKRPSVAETWAVAAPPVQGSEPRRREPDVISGPCGYLADRGKVTSVRWLGLALAALTVIGAMPAAKDYYYFAGAPAWAQVILLVTALQLIYVIWMVSLPDWSTVWVLMLVFALTSAMYGFTLAVTFFTPVDRALLLDLTDVRRTAPAWCGAMLLFTFLGAFLCGRYSFRWYKAYVLASAARG